MKKDETTKAALIRELEEAKKKITEFEGAHRDRQIEEGILNYLESSVRAGIYIVQDEKFRFVNHYASTFLGYKREDIIGRDPITFVHPDDRTMVVENARGMLSGDRVSSYEFRSIAKDGSIHWIEEIVRPTQYEGRAAVLGNMMEVTERVRSREKQKELETLEASILAAIPHAVIGLKDRCIIFANEGVQSVFGWKEEELKGKSTRILYRTDKDYEKMASLYAKLKKQKAVGTEYPCRRKDGNDIECMVSASRIGESLKEKNIVITYEDITERKRAKNELENSREQLRNLSIHLQSVREKESSRIARELHDELGQLLTALNTDLIMMKKKIPEDQVPLIEKTDSMIRLIDMTMNTLKRIYMDLRPGMLDHLGLVAAIRWQFEEFHRRSGIQCIFHSEPEEISIDPDLSTAVFRIFQETLNNILKHAEASKVNVRLKKGKKYIDLVVRDNGKGVKEEELGKANSFGLIGIRERAYSLGGTVAIGGEKNRGTTVKVHIPLQ
ncbi:MAG: PAS domain-containing sensor histidine kinase [Syntrophobacterales bacterium]|nr:MAG: PAS domain-containing sensor histidine kinase [Syntrophobacterales bacterium]